MTLPSPESLVPQSLFWTAVIILVSCLGLLAPQSLALRYGVLHVMVIRKFATNNSRLGKSLRFQRVASQVIADAHDLLRDSEKSYEARAFIPIVCDVRKYGEFLRSRRNFYHKCLAPRMEKNLERILRELAFLERELRALPRPGLSVEDILGSQPEQQEDKDHGASPKASH